MEKKNSTEDDIRPHEEEDDDDDDDDDDMFSDFSSYTSPVRLSNSDNSHNFNVGDNDITRNANPSNIDMGDGKGNMSTDNSSYSSPVSVSNFEHPINTHVVVPDIQKEDHERVDSVNDTATEVEHNSTYNSSYSSPDAHDGEPPFQKEDQDKGNSVIDDKFNFVKNDTELKGQEKHNSTNNSLYSSPERFSSTENSANIHDFQNEEQGKVNIVNDNETDVKLSGQEEHNSTFKSYSSPDRLSTSENSVDIQNKEHQEHLDSVNDTNFNFTETENSIDVHGGEPDIQKEDKEQVDYINDAKYESTATDIELAGQEEHNSDRFSTSEKSIDARGLEPDIKKEENSVTDTKDDSILTDVEIRYQEADKSIDNSSIKLSDSEKLINDPTVDPDLDKENDIYLNDVTPKSVATDNEIQMQDEDDLGSNSVSPNLSESNVQNVNQEENNFLNDDDDDDDDDDDTVNFISKNGEILDSVEDEQDTKKSSEMIDVDDQFKEDEEIKDVKYDPEDDTPSKKENALVLYGTRDLNLAVWQPKSSVFTKFAKFNSLYSVSNIFRRLSGKHNKQIESNEKNEEVNSSERENEVLLDKPSLREIRTSSEKSQEDEVVLESPEIKAIKGRIILYTKLWCKDCKEVRIFLRKKSIRYSEINIDVYPSRKLELEEITGSSNVPRVFFNQELIGGLDELKKLDESGQLEEKIECVMCEMPSSKAPLPPFSGEDDVSSRGVIDELAVIVKKMKESVVVKDRFYKFRRVTNCFLGSDAVDFLSEDQVLERVEAIEFGRKLAKELFFRHVLEENIFEDGKHLYRFLDHDPVISQCQNIPRGIIQVKRQPLVELSNRLRFLLYAILDAYTSEDGKHVAYRTIHGSEEFARYLRIVEELQRVDLNRIAKEERLAFFINLYNLMAIHAILVRGHPEGALDRRKLGNDFKYVIGGRAYSLSDIYNGILRSNQRPPYTLTRPFGISDKRFKVSLPYPEPLIHFALVSGNRSSPALRCYSPKNIDRELMDAARDFLQRGAFILDLDSMTISLTKILKWYSVDFGKNEVEVLKHAANYLEVEKTQTLLELLHSTQLKVVYQRYDWRLNS